ncbi:MAG: hypothetical protein KA144_15145, partial [Xanthomonadaceae bacterium]|nr:hypothetical protein [Xanthomonadaceae bacterium]
MKKQTYLYVPFTGSAQEQMDSMPHVEAWKETEGTRIGRMKADFVEQVVEKNPLLSSDGEKFRDLRGQSVEEQNAFLDKRQKIPAGEPGHWSGDRAQAMKDALEQWRDVSKLQAPQIIQHTGSGKPLDFLNDKDPGTYSLYIVGGHSNTGVDRLASINMMGSSSRKELNGEGVVERMKADGLPKNIESVKCFSCLSGTMVEDNPAFAKGVAVALAKNGFEQATTRGYETPLWAGGYFEKSANPKAQEMADFHKHTGMPGADGRSVPQATRASEVAVDYRVNIHSDGNAGMRNTISSALEKSEAFTNLMPNEQARNGFYDYAAQKAVDNKLPPGMNVDFKDDRLWMHTEAKTVGISAEAYKEVRQTVAESLGGNERFAALHPTQRQGIYNHAAQVAMENNLEGVSGAKFQGDQIALSSKAGAQT